MQKELIYRISYNFGDILNYLNIFCYFCQHRPNVCKLQAGVLCVLGGNMPTATHMRVARRHPSLLFHSSSVCINIERTWTPHGWYKHRNAHSVIDGFIKIEVTKRIFLTNYYSIDSKFPRGCNLKNETMPRNQESIECMDLYAGLQAIKQN